MKIELPDFARRGILKLNDAGYEAYAVGGCVRDSLMGRIPNDWDIASSARPEEIKAVFQGFPIIETGVRHGTLTVMMGKTPLEITTYRIDGAYSDNRHPDKVRFTKSLADDLSRRDFTINALAYHPDAGVIDCHGGIRDLGHQIIRCVGEPDKRFTEDALRVMRGIRFASELSFSLEPNTEKGLRRNAFRLQKIAPERLQTELVKLLCGTEVQKVLRDYPDVIGQLIPEILPMVGFDQQTPYHIYDVYEHTVRSVAAVENDPVLRLTMLFHDIGKPSCFTVDEKGQGHFKGHGRMSVQLCAQILPRLRFDNHTTQQVLSLVKYHDADLQPQEHLIKRWLNRLTPEGFFRLMKVKIADNAAQNPIYNRKKAYEEILRLAQSVLNSKACFSLSSLAINGNDLLKWGVPAGKAVGETLQILLQAVIDGKCPNNSVQLRQYWETMKAPPKNGGISPD